MLNGGSAKTRSAEPSRSDRIPSMQSFSTIWWSASVNSRPPRSLLFGDFPQVFVAADVKGVPGHGRRAKDDFLVSFGDGLSILFVDLVQIVRRQQFRAFV